MNSNGENPKVGKKFQLTVKEWFEKSLNCEFEIERKIAIGNPAKSHSFDIANKDGTVVVECKCYTWTETGNVPSAKMGFANEAAFYLSFLPDGVINLLLCFVQHTPKELKHLQNITLEQIVTCWVK